MRVVYGFSSSVSYMGDYGLLYGSEIWGSVSDELLVFTETVIFSSTGPNSCAARLS